MTSVVPRKDLTFRQGSTYTHDFYYTDEAGSPVNLTGYDARMQIREYAEAGDALYDSDPSHFLVDGANGKVTLTIPAAITEAWAFRRGVYDIELYTAGGTVLPLVQGKVKVEPEITRT